jgi:hypothetical protein
MARFGVDVLVDAVLDDAAAEVLVHRRRRHIESNDTPDGRHGVLRIRS